MKKQKNPKKPKTPIIYYYIATMIMVMLLNTFVFPLILEKDINQ